MVAPVAVCTNRTLDKGKAIAPAGCASTACPSLKYFAHILKAVASQTVDDNNSHYLKSKGMKLGTSTSTLGLRHKGGNRIPRK